MEKVSQSARTNREAMGIPSLVEQAVEKHVTPLITSAIRGVIIFALFYLFALFVITICLLLLLSIERNLRQD